MIVGELHSPKGRVSMIRERHGEVSVEISTRLNDYHLGRFLFSRADRRSTGRPRHLSAFSSDVRNCQFRRNRRNWRPSAPYQRGLAARHSPLDVA